MNAQEKWGRRVNDKERDKSMVSTRHVNANPTSVHGAVKDKKLGHAVDAAIITRLQTMFFKVTQSKETIGIETSHIYGATGSVQLAVEDITKYQTLMEILEKRVGEDMTTCIEGWCRIERDPVHKGLMISIEPGQLSMGVLCFGPREMETLQIRALIKTLGAVQMIGAEMQMTSTKQLLCG